MNRREVLSELLEHQRAYHAEYRGGLSNHLPMALIALERMGAPPERLRQYARLYERRLEFAPDAGRILSREQWREQLGRRARYADFLATFREEIGGTGWAATLRGALPILLPGCAAAAFHPPIRLAYAIEAEEPEEMAIALAYWAARFLPLGPAPAPDQQPLSEEPETLLRRLAEDPAFVHQADDDSLIDAEMKRATAMPEFAPVIGWLEIRPDTPRRLARAALEVYAATGDFTALHMVTGMQAARLLLPHCEDRDAALRWVWQALAAAYLSIGKPPIPHRAALESTRAPDWPPILEEARRAADEHVIKLVYSCWAEDQAYADPLYRALADSVVRSQNPEVR
jgi:hypothetical protein